jgi:hypothetical protein
MLPDREIDKAALLLLSRFDKQPVAQIRAILRRADFWLDATSRLDLGAGEYMRAFSALILS